MHGSPTRRNSPIVPWSIFCQLKKFGGLRVNDLETMNKALLLKVLYNISKKPSPLVSQVLELKYFPTSTSQQLL